MAKCVVVGGGLSGLSTAYLLSRLPRSQVSQVQLFEANGTRFGGAFLTNRNPETGSLHDFGPHSARIAAPASSPLLRLVSSLGFKKNDVFWMPRLRRYIYAAGALRPISFFSLRAQPPFSHPLLSTFIRRALSRSPGPLKEDISVDEFLRTRLDDEFADYLGTALMRGICGVDSKLISASAFLGHMIQWEKQAPNLILGAARSLLTGKLRSLYPPKKDDVSLQALDRLLPGLNEDLIPTTKASVLNFSTGMQTLTDRLVETLRGLPHVELFNGAQICGLSIDGGKIEVEVRDKAERLDCDAVFICTSPAQMGRLLGGRNIIPESVSRLLSPELFTTASIAVAGLEFGTSNLKVPHGFGHLLPLCEDETIMGVIYDSCCSPRMDGRLGETTTTRFTVMMAPKPEWIEATRGETSFQLNSGLKEELTGIATEALRKQLGLSLPKPCFAHAGLWVNTIPTYPVGHLENVKKIRTAIAGRLGKERGHTLHLVGCALDGVGVNDCVKSAIKAVDNFATSTMY